MPRKGGSVSIIKQKNEKLIKHSTSDRVSICTQCGKAFSQEWRPEYEAYTSFKTCPHCRMINARGGMNLTVEYTPHWGQKLVHDSEARFKVIAAGARWGKDRCSVMEGIRYFVELLNEDRGPEVIPHALWWIIAPTDKIARQNWRELMHNLPRELIVDISKTTQTIETINGGIIEVHSAYDPESLVAVGLDLVTITEAARIADMEDVWANLEARLNSPGRGLNGNGGRAIINSSPLGMNYFYKMWKWGQKDTSDWDPDWESWKFSTWDNPYMAVRGEQITKNGRTYKENLQRRMSVNRYKQDYEAEFIKKINSVFPNIDRCFVKPQDIFETKAEIELFWKDWEKVDPWETYTIGYDPASKGDGNPCWIRNSRGKVVKIDPMTNLDWDSQWDRLAFYSRMYNGAKINFGATGLGETIESQLIKRGLECVPYNEQGSNKAKLVENLAIIVEQQWCQIPWSQEVENQFKDYVSIQRESGNDKYKNETSDGFDDMVSAAYFCFADYCVIEEEAPFMGMMGGVNSNSNLYELHELEESNVIDMQKHKEDDQVKEDDMLREMCIKQGYVPEGCKLSGDMIFALINSGQNPCTGCYSLSKCKIAKNKVS